MEEIHGEAADFGISVIEDQFAFLRAEGSEIAVFDILGVADLSDFFDVLLGDGEDHSFLCFGDPYFGVGQAVVLERCAIEVDSRAELFPHFSDGGGEPACAAIGDGVEEASVFVIAQTEYGVEGFLFGDGVTDLDGVGEFVGM